MGSIRGSMHIRQTAPLEKPLSFSCLHRSALRRPTLSPRTSRSRPAYLWFSRVCLEGSSWRPRNPIDVAGGWFGNDEISSTNHCRSFFVSKIRQVVCFRLCFQWLAQASPSIIGPSPQKFLPPFGVISPHANISSPAKPSGPVTDTCCLLVQYGAMTTQR